MARTLLASATVPDTDQELRLYENGGSFTILMPGKGDLMNSRQTGSELALAELACANIQSHRPRLLVGGLGMGFTLASALAVSNAQARVIVAELVPEIVAWNRSWLGNVAGQPLEDDRVEVFTGDVGDLLREPGEGFDAIMLDVDNGPEALLRVENDWLYGRGGLSAARAALRPGGNLAVEVTVSTATTNSKITANHTVIT